MNTVGLEFKDLNVTHSIYYILTPKFLRKMPLAFWGGVSIVAFGVAISIMKIFNESMSIESTAAFCSLFTLIPMSHIQDYQRFYRLIEEFIDLFKLGANTLSYLHFICHI